VMTAKNETRNQFFNLHKTGRCNILIYFWAFQSF
jgi:hypothetical protein